MGQSTEFVVMIHSIPYDKGVWTRKSHEIRMTATLPSGAGLVQQDAQFYRCGTARTQMLACKGQGAAAVENVIDEQDVTTPDVELGIPQKPYIS